VFQVPQDRAQELTEVALEAGYRHIDTAAAYGNEAGVGSALAATGVPRDEIFVTTKLWNSDQGYDSTFRAYDKSRSLLGLDSLDLYLIHFPAPKRLEYVETWRAFEKLYADGQVRSIGVSNFKWPFLDRLLSGADVVPAVHQIEVHPTYQQAELDALSQSHGMVVEAYSPLGRGVELEAPTIVRIAAEHGVTTVQVILRWHVQRGRVPLPKSTDPARIAQNIDLSGFTLTDDELAQIDGLEAGVRTGEDIETFN
jgi:diketogulonate reductase-like aldo/keto reductase